MGELRIFRVVMVSGFLLFALKVVDLATGSNSFLPPAIASGGAPAEPAPAAAGDAKHDEAKPDAAAAAPADHGADAGHDAASASAGDAAKADAEGDDANPENMSRAEIELLQKLSARRTELDRRSQELDMREKLLEAS